MDKLVVIFGMFLLLMTAILLMYGQVLISLLPLFIGWICIYSGDEVYDNLECK